MPGTDGCPPGCASDCVMCLARGLPFADCEFEVLNIKSLIGDMEHYLQDNLTDEAVVGGGMSGVKYYSPEDFNVQVTMQGFSILHINVRSIACNFLKLKILLHSLVKRFDIIICSETWLENKYLQYPLPDYQFFHQDRDSRGGGVCIYVRDDITCQVINEFTYSVPGGFEALTLKVKSTNFKPVIVSAVYRSPSFRPQVFLSHLSKFLQSELFDHCKSIFTGDFNLDLSQSSTNPCVEEFVNLFEFHGLLSLINMPTRVQGNSMSILDCFFTNLHQNYQAGVIIDDISDHFPIFCT